MSNKTLHIGDTVRLADGRVGILRSISRTQDEVSVEIELRYILDFNRRIGWVHGNPDELGIVKL